MNENNKFEGSMEEKAYILLIIIRRINNNNSSANFKVSLKQRSLVFLKKDK